MCRSCQKKDYAKNAERVKARVAAYKIKHADKIAERKITENGMLCKFCKRALIGMQNTYCSIKCSREQIYSDYVESWLSGNKEEELKCYRTSSYIRRWALERADRKCEQCGWSQINPHTNTLPLVLDHIDGNYKNNRPENLRILCPNCDALTSTYKGANRGNGRHARAERYRAGKSY